MVIAVMILIMLVCVFFIISSFPLYSSLYAMVFAIHERNAKLWIYDERGIPRYNYSNHGLERNPLFIATEVIYHSQIDTPRDIEVSLGNANWLINNSLTSGNHSWLRYNYSTSSLEARFDLYPPWVSAMTQTRAALAMIYAYQISSDDRYLKYAEQFLDTLYVDVKDGGVTYKTANNDSGWWYEEYPSGEIEPRILNGMMAILRDLNTYYELTSDVKAKFLFDKGIASLKSNIYRYDNNGHSFYDALGNLANKKYHTYHVQLLSDLLNIVRDEVLQRYHAEWKAYSGPFPLDR
jgi:heparosan-N-sulfate-glucuronate 5-epimerase